MTMTRKLFTAYVALTAMFFLVCLGVRNVSLEQGRSPKPRPRAVVEEAKKAPIVITCDQQLDVELCPTFTVAPIIESRFIEIVHLVRMPDLPRVFLPSRASPVLS